VPEGGRDASGAELLLEVGFEEMPAPWLPGLGAQLRERFGEAASREHLAPADVQVFWTPRRLALGARVRRRQEDREEKVWGPSLKVAKDQGGKWTNAAQGFAKKNGVVPEGLGQAPRDPRQPDELHLLFLKRSPGRDAMEVLPAVVGATLRGLAFPKRMSWDAWLDDGKGAFPFGRPIRWLAAVLDGRVVPFAIRGVEDGGPGAVVVASGDRSTGHRFLPKGPAPEAVSARTVAGLRDGLRAAFVLLDPGEREGRIADGLAAGVGPGETAEDHGLLAEWRDLVEYPTVAFGRIPDEFRALPRQVLETVLVHHQKYVPLVSGGVVARFAAVTNTDGSAAAEIVRGMERVVVARLRDAAFFYGEDVKRPLAERVPDLAGVTFHKSLGTYLDKTERVVGLVDAMRDASVLGAEVHASAREAARLAKADLTTLMVREFPELQGVMGGIYLRAQGAPARGVAAAVEWHYHPLSIEEASAPAGALGGDEAAVFSAVSLADKLDTLAGYFGLGLAPTGSSDPFGLRRAAQGVVRVLLDFWPAEAAQRPGLKRLVAAAVAGVRDRLQKPEETVTADLEGFLLDRLRYVLGARGFPADEVEAALGAREPDAIDDPRETWRRLQALHRVRSEAREDFEHLAVAFKRAKNILGEGASAAVDGAVLSEPAERDLHAAVARLGSADGNYETRLRALATLRGPVDRFFDDVLVMAEDPKVRANRLGLLARALSLFYRIADISKLGG
jgi:glycyl-tRNA synthetase beta chain